MARHLLGGDSLHGHVEDICWAYIRKNVLDGIVFAVTNVIWGSEHMWRGQAMYVSPNLL